MSKRREELKRQNNVQNEDAYAVVERHPRRSSPILLIFVLVAIYLLVSYLSSLNFEFQTVTDTILSKQTIPEKEKLSESSDVLTIHQLISEGAVDEIKHQLLLIDREAINEVVSGMTPIMLAASLGNVELIDLLFTHGADPNKRGSSQRTALQYASEKNHIEAAKQLLAYGADIDAYDNGRLTPLIMAANRGYSELGLLYTERGANVNIQHVQGWTALIDAVIRDDARLVNALLDAGADKNLATNNGLKAIDYARQYGHKKMMKILGK